VTPVVDVEQLRGACVLTIGDVMLDEYVWGEVERISPEAPVPVVQVRERTAVAGGAANTAAGIAAVGARALLGGVVGADGPADVLRDALSGAGVHADGLIVEAGRMTTTKTRIIARAQQVVRTDAETDEPVAGGTEDALLEWVGADLRGADAVVISDYGKGVVTTRVAQAVIGRAQQAGRPVVVDSKGRDYGRYAGATVVTPNQQDAARAASLHIDGRDDLIEAVARLSAACGGAAVLITRGADGMTLFEHGRETLHVAADARDVFDVTGAGDTVVALLAVALGRGLDLHDAVRIANTAAGVVVGKLGTSTVTLDEVAERLP
jgi:D-beta-D-heptose 7-phosphate kinase/D-beta-D-heptose 1-phosphate adenosyltransferase